MKKILHGILGKANYLKLENLKKSVFPTKYDKEQAQFLKSQLDFYSALIKPNDLCFDIGGNIGLKTNVFLQLKARVVTLEPQQDCVDILMAKYGSKATILKKGAGAEHAVKEFYLSNNSALSSFNKTWIAELDATKFVGNKIDAVEKIEIVTLDSLIDSYGYPNFIKIDVEGYETEVLKGLNKPFGTLSFEYAVPEQKENLMASLIELNNKYPALVCNFAICNESSFAFETWKPMKEMIQYVQQDYFNTTFAGDIYVTSKG